MDHNNYNNNNNGNNGQSSDPFYSYNHTYAGENGNAGNTAAGGNAAGSENTANAGGCAAGGFQNQNNTYQERFYQTASAPQNSGKKQKKPRKPGGFGMKLAKCAALALVFGLVAGTVFEGVQLASGAIFGDDSRTASAEGNTLSQSSSGDVKTTSTSSNYVATDVSDIVEEVMPSIVAITNVSIAEYQSLWGGREVYEVPSFGSGIIISQNDEYLYVVTNNHVVAGANSLTVTFVDESTASAEVRGTDPSTDLAVIQIPLSGIAEETLSNIKVATIGNSDELKVGEASIAIGNALGYGQSVTTGCISALDREVSVSDSGSNTNYTQRLIQTDAAINPGNSGGALLNAAGEVIGINSVKYADTDVEGIGYAIPISTASPIIEDLITKEKVDESESAFLGVSGVDVTSEVAEAYNLPTGVSVRQVTKGSAAEKAGIQVGDIITSFDGREVKSMEELSTRMQYYRAGDTVEVVIKRASDGTYAEQTLEVTLGKRES